MSKKIITLFILALIVIPVFFFVTYAMGDHEILLLGIDPSEKRPGLGGVDMAFIISTSNGRIVNKTTIYPGGMTHPTAEVPAYLQSLGQGKLLLHDSFWENDTANSAQIAKEIVEYNTNRKTDIVVVVTPTALDDMINAIGPITANGQVMENVSSIEWLRDDQDRGNTRGDSVEAVMSAMSDATRNPVKILPLTMAVIRQYMAGNLYIFF
ncbi:MAG: DUF4012 domain-containing protein [Methanobacteriaceae archaeon]|nr:DUF4012 domain-containing protein [Methanobacteriaceae archaeon]